MTPYAIRDVIPEEIELFEKIRNAVINLPDIDLGVDKKGEKIILSCHILGRAIAKIFGLKYVDGYFYPSFQHTWLLTSQGNIIDVYPVAIFGGPLLIVNKEMSPAFWLYKRRSARKISHGQFSQLSFRRSVRKIITCLKSKEE